MGSIPARDVDCRKKRELETFVLSFFCWGSSVSGVGFSVKKASRGCNVSHETLKNRKKDRGVGSVYEGSKGTICI